MASTDDGLLGALAGFNPVSATVGVSSTGRSKGWGTVKFNSPEEAEAAGIETEPDQLRREAGLHTPFESVAGLAQQAGIDTLVLVRLRPPPVYDFQVMGMLGDTFDGEVVIAEDGEEVTPARDDASTQHGPDGRPAGVRLAEAEAAHIDGLQIASRGWRPRRRCMVRP